MSSMQKVGILVGKETTFGDEASTIDKVLGGYQTSTPIYKIDPIARRTYGTRGIAYAVPGAEHYGMDMEMDLQEGRLFYYFMGGVAESGSDPYLHECTFSEPIPSLSIENIKDTTRSIKLLGSKFNELKLSSVIGEAIKAETNTISASIIKDLTPGTPAKIAKDPFIFHQTSIVMNSVEYNDVLQSHELNMSHNLAERFSHAQGHVEALPEGPLDADMTVEVAVEDDDFIDLFMNGTQFSTVLKYTKVAATDEAIITIPKCKVFDLGEPFEVEGDFFKANASVTIIEPEDITINVYDDIQNW